MGANLTARLDSEPQTTAVVCPEVTALPDPREVLRCFECRLVQFRTMNNLCRRCHVSLDAPPPPPPPAPVLEPELEPGIETAEATGRLVPLVASAIRRWRQRRGLSQRQLAERMHVPRTYVSKIENDKATPTITSLQRMATAMETNIAALLQAGEPAADLLQDTFVQALLPYLPNLGPAQFGRLLEASRQLAHAHC
ncbi:MAG: helix-turn-helix domain-containing protein [Terriglobales bacterium]